MPLLPHLPVPAHLARRSVRSGDTNRRFIVRAIVHPTAGSVHRAQARSACKVGAKAATVTRGPSR